jgi:hypothetical protein
MSRDHHGRPMAGQPAPVRSRCSGSISPPRPGIWWPLRRIIDLPVIGRAISRRGRGPAVRHTVHRYVYDEVRHFLRQQAELLAP